ncbi:MAG: PepSY domain-containing protein [Moraxella sp.]|nr:PepSY domain-containing protein [Moraxella sp.]
MKLTKAIFLSLILATTAVGVAHADYDDYIEAKVYQDPQLDNKIEQAIRIVKNKGYEVADVDIDTRFGKPVLEIEAYKGRMEYEIILSYPDLKIISERPDY